MATLSHAYSFTGAGIDTNFDLLYANSGNFTGSGIDVNFSLTQLPTGNFVGSGMDANVGVDYITTTTTTGGGTGGTGGTGGGGITDFIPKIDFGGGGGTGGRTGIIDLNLPKIDVNALKPVSDVVDPVKNAIKYTILNTDNRVADVIGKLKEPINSGGTGQNVPAGIFVSIAMALVGYFAGKRNYRTIALVLYAIAILTLIVSVIK